MNLSSYPLSTLFALAALSLLPIAFMTLTSFVKMSVVLSLVRNAIGVNQVPSGTVIAALAMTFTVYVMAPVGTQMVAAAGPHFENVPTDAPLRGEDVSAVLAGIQAAAAPLVAFLERNTGQRERTLFFDLARRSRGGAQSTVTDKDFLVLAPAFLITELTEAFQIGFLIFIPFLIIDMVIANVLLSLGMHMLSPTTVSLPFKLLLFVTADGWYVIARGLVLGYR